MKTTIEKYRGIEIWFDTHYETFSCDIDHESSVKKSYAAVKKFIDEWKKDTANFKSFRVEPNPISDVFSSGKKGTVVGIRKDNRFVLETEDGAKEQISDYYLDRYILHTPENAQYWEELAQHEKEVEEQRLAANAKRKEIEAKFKITTLKQVKPNYL
jgi:hypothetical protein